MDILPVKDAEVFLLAVVEEKGLHVVLLDEPRLLHDAVVLVGKDGGIEALPLRVGKGNVVERFHLPAQVADEFLLGMQRQILVGLVLQLPPARLRSGIASLSAPQPGSWRRRSTWGFL